MTAVLEVQMFVCLYILRGLHYLHGLHYQHHLHGLFTKFTKVAVTVSSRLVYHRGENSYIDNITAVLAPTRSWWVSPGLPWCSSVSRCIWWDQTSGDETRRSHSWVENYDTPSNIHRAYDTEEMVSKKWEFFHSLPDSLKCFHCIFALLETFLQSFFLEIPPFLDLPS